MRRALVVVSIALASPSIAYAQGSAPAAPPASAAPASSAPPASAPPASAPAAPANPGAPSSKPMSTTPPVSDEAKRHFEAGVALLEDPEGERVEDAYREFK